MEEHQIPVLRILGSSPSRVVFFRFIKKLLKLPKRTNSERMKLALGIPDLCTYLISRLLYGLPAFVDQESWINRIDKVMLTNIQKLLKLPIRTNNSKLKLAFGLLDLNTYLV